MDMSILEAIGCATVIYVFYKVAMLIVGGGFRAASEWILECILAFPGIDGLFSAVVRKEIAGFTQKLFVSQHSDFHERPSIPETGLSYEQVLKELQELKSQEAQIGTKVFAYKYIIDEQANKLQDEAIMMFSDKLNVSENHQRLAEVAQCMFMNDNALSPTAFPSLRKFELECVNMTASTLHAPSSACGFLTSGGTESILMSVKTYRDLARKYKPHITKPEIIAPVSVHPALEKAADYFGLTVRHTALNADYEADAVELEKAITENTILIVASAPSYPHGILDPVEDIGLIARRYNIPFHVDACYGGFMLPWLEKLGLDIPTFDFRCQGVTSMSADLHKFAYAPKGSSVVLYLNEEIRKFQLFAYSAWPGGLFGSTTMAGTRSGGAMAAAWATLRHLGASGYMKYAKELNSTSTELINGIRDIKGIRVIGRPVMNCFAIESIEAELNILVVADAMENRGWRMERQQYPASIHFSILPQHIGQETRLLLDLKDACKECWGKKGSAGDTASVYGLISKVPSECVKEKFVVEFFNGIYK